MKIAYVADVHLGNPVRWGGRLESGMNARCRAVVDVLTRAHAKAWELGAERFVVAGDLFDTEKPLPQLVAEAQQTLRTHEYGDGPDHRPISYVLRGNHDKFSDARGDDALGPLKPAGIRVVDEPCRDDVVAFVPHMNGRAIEWLPKAVRALMKGVPSVHALCCHVGVITDSTPPYLLDAPDAVPVRLLAELGRELGVSAVFCGNWHDRQVRWVTGNGEALRKPPEVKAGRRDDDTVMVCQLGALCPTGFDNAGFDGYGTLVIHDTEVFETPYTVVEIPGPRFVVVHDHDAAAAAVKRAKDRGHSLYLSYVASAARLAAAKEYVTDLVSQRHVVEAEAVTDRSELREAGLATAVALRKTSTLDEAVGVYVANAAFQDEPDRSLVLGKCQHYLAGIARAQAMPVVVRTIECEGLFELGLEPCDMVLPEKGLVLIQGPNGSGKTCQIDSVSVALWGETGRGVPPWCGGSGYATAGVLVGKSELEVKRWGKDGCEGVKFDEKKYGTPTKAQAELTRCVGTFKQWRATHVFDAQDDGNSRFGRLSDGDRKVFVEQLIGLDFKDALERCRKERKASQEDFDEKEYAVRQATRVHEAAQRAVAECESGLGEATTAGEQEAAKVEKVRTQLADTNDDADELRLGLGDLREKIGKAQAMAHHAEEDLNLAAHQKCPKCRRPMDEAMRESVKADALATRSETNKTLAELQKKLHACEYELRTNDRECKRLSDRLADAIADRDEVRRRENALDVADEALTTAANDLAAAAKGCAEAKAALAVITATEQVLGLRGVRSVMVGQVLGVLEQGANSWLERFRFPGRVTLSVGDKGEILFELDGVGSGRGFRALSRGQQARVNLAFVRAFASLCGDAGTLFFDEPFDGLDSDGREDAVRLIEELAATRCVVLISHDERLTSVLKPTATYEVRKS